MESVFRDLLEANRPILADGAMGTNLFDAGLENGEAPEFWCIEHPDQLLALHSRFLEAGSDLILTNSFGGNRYRLKLHGAQGRVAELNAAAARLACQARTDYQKKQTARPIAVAGSIGPTGELIDPIGDLPFNDAVLAFEEQVAGLAEGGVDLFWIETLSSREELEAALKAVHNVAPELPVAATLSFDTNGRTMMGLEPAEALRCNLASPHPAHAFGANCGTGASSLLVAIREMRCTQIAQADTASPPPQALTPLIAKANCGIPEWVDDRIVYSGTPEVMADYARLAASLGVKIIGGCCGSKPMHIAAMATALSARAENVSQTELPSVADITSCLGPIDLPQAPSSATDESARRKRRRRAKSNSSDS